MLTSVYVESMAFCSRVPPSTQKRGVSQKCNQQPGPAEETHKNEFVGGHRYYDTRRPSLLGSFRSCSISYSFIFFAVRVVQAKRAVSKLRSSMQLAARCKSSKAFLASHAYQTSCCAFAFASGSLSGEAPHQANPTCNQ